MGEFSSIYIQKFHTIRNSINLPISYVVIFAEERFAVAHLHYKVETGSLKTV